MELKVLKRSKNSTLIELKGGSVGFVNLLRKELWNDEGVDEAAYIKEHPYMAEPKIFVKMKGRKSPRTALKGAVKRIQSDLKGLKIEFERAFKS